MQAAEDELSKLGQTVGERSDSVEEKAGKDEGSSRTWLPAVKDFDWLQLTSGEWLKGEI